MTTAEVVLGLQAGDESKAKVAHTLLKRSNTNKHDPKFHLVARFNGGPNAGGMVVQKGKKKVLHQLPVGVLEGVPSLLGPQCVVNPIKLLKEMEQFPDATVRVAYNACIIEPSHIEEDIATDKIGSTSQGIRQAYRDRALKVARRAQDVPELKSLVVDPYDILWGSHVLLQGAQGYDIDINWGDYPFVTSSDCTVAGALSVGIPPQGIQAVHGAAKIYRTYSGFKEFQPADPALAELAEFGNERGNTTGRLRQTDWLDLERLKRACRVNGVTHLTISKCDVLRKVKKFKAYDGAFGLVTFRDFASLVDRIRQVIPTPSILFSSSPES